MFLRIRCKRAEIEDVTREEESAVQYYRSRIKCLLFMPKIQLKRVCGMVKNKPHTILKIKKRKVPQIFCFFSMVWGDLNVTRGV